MRTSISSRWITLELRLFQLAGSAESDWVQAPQIEDYELPARSLGFELESGSSVKGVGELIVYLMRLQPIIMYYYACIDIVYLLAWISAFSLGAGVDNVT